MPTGNLLRQADADWTDLRIVPQAFQFGGSADPDLSDWQPGGSGTVFPVYVFEKDDYITATCQIPHSYKPGSDLYFHIHWTPRDRGNEESGNKVGWKVDYSIANVGANFPVATGSLDLSDACSGADHHHEITPDVLVSGAGISISAMIMLKIYRSDTGTDDTWVGTTAAQRPAILEFDIHFQQNSLGSNLISSKDYNG